MEPKNDNDYIDVLSKENEDTFYCSPEVILAFVKKKILTLEGFPDYNFLGQEVFRHEQEIDLNNAPFFQNWEFDEELLKSKLKNLIGKTQPCEDGFCDPLDGSQRPFWLFIHYIDDVVPAYQSMGSLSKHTHWESLLCHFLRDDVAEQAGGSEFFIFDLRFRWSISVSTGLYNSNSEQKLVLRKWERKDLIDRFKNRY